MLSETKDMDIKYEEEYVFSKYESKYKKSLLQLLNSEWKYSEDYFDWKYRNPYSDEILGWVVVHKNKVVGFRGLMARNRSQVNEQNVKVFSFGDGFVHKDYRRKGIFSKLNKYSVNDLAEFWSKDRVPGFVYMMSSNEYSTPVYLKMGWRALSRRKMLIHQNFSGVILNQGYGKKYIKKLIDGLNKLVNIVFNVDKHELGRYRLLIGSGVYSHSMADLYKRCTEDNRLIQIKDKHYYDWRLKNPNEKYVVSYLVDCEDKLVAYAVFQERKATRCLIDYCYNEYQDFKLLINGSISRLSSKLFYTIGFGKSKQELEDLRNLNFREPKIIYKILPRSYKITRANLYFIVCPVSANIAEGDWMVDNVDLSDISNWDLNMIDDDGV